MELDKYFCFDIILKSGGFMKKMCYKCNTLRDIKRFYKHTRDGYQSTCKDCKREESRTRNKDPKRQAYNKDKYRTWFKKHGKEYYSQTRVRIRRNERMREYLKKPEVKLKLSSRIILQIAIKKGLVKKLPCSICNNSKSEAHHVDYTKPLEVQWLCRNHHINMHYPKRGETRS